MILRAIALSAAVCAVAAAAPGPTFSKEVAPILQKNCQGCHRPGEAAPFSLLTYKEARPWAASIREAVKTKKMPPWNADPHFGKFANDRSLSEAEINTLVAWASNGAPEGNPKDLPKPLTFTTGWNIGKPDVALSMPQKFEIPAKGTVDYQYILVPMNLKEDKWVEAAEVRPGNRALLHHVIAYVRPAGSKWMADAVPGVPWVPKKQGEGNMAGAEFLVGYAPGVPPTDFGPGRAKMIKAGSDIVLQLHYTANGQAGSDQSTIGLRSSKSEVKERVVTLAASTNRFAIPPGDGNYRVDSDFTLGSDTRIISFSPHMHLRGKDFDFRATYPTGEKQVLLNVPKYDFNWQIAYQPSTEVIVPKGTKIECTAHFDNSVNNPYNPDPTKTVKWGDQSWEEMMIGFFDVVIDAKQNPATLFPSRQKKEVAAVLE